MTDGETVGVAVDATQYPTPVVQVPVGAVVPRPIPVGHDEAVQVGSYVHQPTF